MSTKNIQYREEIYDILDDALQATMSKVREIQDKSITLSEIEEIIDDNDIC